MSATFTLEIQLAPDVKALLEKLIAALPPKAVNYSQQFPLQSATEQAARMRVRQAQALTPQQSTPTYSSWNPCPSTVAQMYPQATTPRPQPTRQSQPAAPQAVSHSNPAPVAPAPQYTQEQLARATATLADAGKIQQIRQLFQQFGIQQLTALPKERYGEYATALRQMGAHI